MNRRTGKLPAPLHPTSAGITVCRAKRTLDSNNVIMWNYSLPSAGERGLVWAKDRSTMSTRPDHKEHQVPKAVINTQSKATVTMTNKP